MNCETGWLDYADSLALLLSVIAAIVFGLWNTHLAKKTWKSNRQKEQIDCLSEVGELIDRLQSFGRGPNSYAHTSLSAKIAYLFGSAYGAEFLLLRNKIQAGTATGPEVADFNAKLLQLILDGKGRAE